jgi:hypothetical protein
MTDKDIMFLPDYLRDGLAGAMVNGHKIAAPATLVLQGFNDEKMPINGPLMLTSFLALLTLAGLFVKKLRILGKVMSFLLLLATGLLGCLILVMWFATDHQGCSDNFNLLWCLPTNIVIAFFKPKGKGKYGLIGFTFIVISITVSLFRVQGLIWEFAPILLALAGIYFSVYRDSLKSKIKQPVHA